MNKKDFPAFDKLLVAFDGSRDSQKAVRYACALALEHGSQVTIVHAYNVGSYAYPVMGMPQSGYDALERAAKQTAAEVVSRGATMASEMGIHALTEVVRSASPVQAIVDFAAAEKFDLVLIGTRGNTGFKRLILGSVSAGVVQQASCPVLVVR